VRRQTADRTMNSSQHRTLAVTVVIPTYRGAGRIGACLRSLAAQSLARDAFEVVVVQNGPADHTPAVIAEVRAIHTDLNVRTIRVSEPGAGRARNVGLRAARGEYVTFVDDDDAVSREYLEALLAQSAAGVVGLGYLTSIGAPGQAPDFNTGASLAQLRTKGVVPARRLTSALGYTAAKMVSTELARSVLFDPDLRSGEDVVFWAQVLAKSGFKFGVSPVQSHAVYYRAVRANSVSRQALTYDFNVTQRLDVLERLNQISAATTSLDVAEAVRRLTGGQLGFIGRFVRESPERYGELLDELQRRKLTIPLEGIKKGAARELAILYVALPYNDTSSLVAARRIRAGGALVDVISSDMSALRDYDHSAEAIWSEFVDQAYETDSKPSTAHWPGITDFCWKGMAQIEDWEAAKGSYRRVYSRAMWPASHVLAALYKIRNPDVHWVAEFSDPLSHDIKGEVRRSNGQSDPLLMAEFRDALVARGITPPEDDNMYVWVEKLAYALADEMLFTNEHQRAYMLGYLKDPQLVARAAEHSEIAPHPTLPERFYHLSPSTYALNPSVVNIGYFGVFYATRGLSEVVEGLRTVSPASRARLRLHVFTPKPEELAKEAAAAGIADVVVANPYVSYLEFLNLTTKFDALLVNDTRTADTHNVNPYLPSKISDYAGSGRAIWGVVESGSSLSQQRLDYVSTLGDADGARDVLERLVAGKR
jgi:glycosyltransferase involved in cell wall biosynthesis